MFRRALHFAPFEFAWGKRADWCSSLGLGCLGYKQDVAAEAHGPDVVGVHTPQAKEITHGVAGLGRPCCPVPLEDGVKEIYCSNGDALIQADGVLVDWTNQMCGKVRKAVRKNRGTSAVCE